MSTLEELKAAWDAAYAADADADAASAAAYAAAYAADADADAAYYAYMAELKKTKGTL